MLRYIAILTIVFGIQLTHAQPSKNTSQSGKQPTNSNANNIDGNDAKTQQPNKTDTEPSAYQKERDARDDAFRADQAKQNGIITSATVIIAIFGGLSFFAAAVYAFISLKQWKQNRELFDLAERPSLGIEGAMLDRNARVIRALVRNSGKAPARNTIVSTTPNIPTVEELGGQHYIEPVETEKFEGIPSRTVVPVGAIKFAATNPIDPETLKEVYNGTRVLFIWIKIEYEGFGGRNPYILKYFGRFNPNNPSGEFEDCPEYNDAT